MIIDFRTYSVVTHFTFEEISFSNSAFLLKWGFVHFIQPEIPVEQLKKEKFQKRKFRETFDY